MHKSRKEAFYTASPSFVAFKKTYEVKMTHGSTPLHEQKNSKRKFSESDSSTSSEGVSSEKVDVFGIPVNSIKVEKHATNSPYKLKDSEAATSKTDSSCSSSDVDYRECSFSKKYNQMIKRKRTETEVVYFVKNEDTTVDIDDRPAVEPYGSCEACGKKFSGPKCYQDHLASKRHKRKMAEHAILKQVTKDGVVDVDLLKEMIMEKCEKKTGEASESDEISDELKQQISASAIDILLEDSNKYPYECQPCGKVFSDLISFVLHLKGKRHSNMEEKMKFHGKMKVHPAKESGSRSREIENLMSRVEITKGIATCSMCNATLTGYGNALNEEGGGHSRKLSNQEHIPKTPLKKFKRK